MVYVRVYAQRRVQAVCNISVTYLACGCQMHAEISP